MIRWTAILIALLSIAGVNRVGGLTMFEKTSLGINGADTFLTGNVGGVK
jgi:hypothetical protein